MRLIVFTLGLATLWAKVRVARYTAEHTPHNQYYTCTRLAGEEVSLLSKEQVALSLQMSVNWHVQASGAVETGGQECLDVAGG